MSIEIIPICHDCNEELSNWDRFLNKNILILLVIPCVLNVKKEEKKNQKRTCSKYC